jgi:hypothetical protein
MHDRAIPVRAYIIGLENRYRGQQLEAELAGHGISVIRVNGVEGTFNGRSVLSYVDQNAAKVFMGRKLTVGEAGAALAHLEAYRTLLATEDEWGLVLEDDARLIDEPCEVLAGFNGPRTGAQIVLLYGRAVVASDVVTWSRAQFTGYQLASLPVSAVAYVINRAGAELLLRSSTPLVSPADWPRRGAYAIDFSCAYPFVFAPRNDDETSASAVGERTDPARRPIRHVASKVAGVLHIKWLLRSSAYGAYSVYLGNEVVGPFVRRMSTLLSRPRFVYLTPSREGLPTVRGWAGRSLARLRRFGQRRV